MTLSTANLTDTELRSLAARFFDAPLSEMDIASRDPGADVFCADGRDSGAPPSRTGRPLSPHPNDPWPSQLAPPPTLIPSQGGGVFSFQERDDESE